MPNRLHRRGEKNIHSAVPDSKKEHDYFAKRLHSFLVAADVADRLILVRSFLRLLNGCQLLLSVHVHLHLYLYPMPLAGNTATIHVGHYNLFK